MGIPLKSMIPATVD